MFSQRAFTLIELIITLLISAVVAVISVTFIGQSGQALVDTGARQQLADTANIISEQLSRRIRQSLPGSVRTTNDDKCIEFMPLVVAAAYTDLRGGSATTSVTAIPPSQTLSFTGYLSVYPLNGNLYNPKTTGPLTPFTVVLPAGSAPVTISFSSPHRFTVESPESRLFISAAPQTICQEGEWLYLYSGYGFVNNTAQLQAALPSTYATGRQVLASSLEPDSLEFRYSPQTLKRNALVTFSYQLTASNGDSLNIAQEVQVRNVP